MCQILSSCVQHFRWNFGGPSRYQRRRDTNGGPKRPPGSDRQARREAAQALRRQGLQLWITPARWRETLASGVPLRRQAEGPRAWRLPFCSESRLQPLINSMWPQRARHAWKLAIERLTCIRRSRVAIAPVAAIGRCQKVDVRLGSALATVVGPTQGIRYEAGRPTNIQSGSRPWPHALSAPTMIPY